ncbi:MAG: DUF58 domain-containing protein [Sphingobacteriales bacterium]|nr:MAG: DUF58 domain-containing protein [Sphingobacteriales bacterium]
MYSVGVLLFTVIDFYLLFVRKGGIVATRSMQSRFSLGDNNNVTVSLQNQYAFKARLRIIDELPEQFQERNFLLFTEMAPRGKEKLSYILKPTTRGVFEFGNVLCFVRSPLRLIQRRFSTDGETNIKVYPSFQQLKKYQLIATSDNYVAGMKKVRRLGHSIEFEKIKNYVPGDDVRTINWKATARSSSIMVNTFTDARQQQVYCLLDKGRAMKMPFDGLTLLDHSINAALALLNITLLKNDRAGLVTFADKVDDMVVSEKRTGQLNHLTEALYKQQTDFKESSYEALWMALHRGVTQRSCLILFTNFETYSSLERQLPYLKRMASRHLLYVVFFQNTLLKHIHETEPDTTEGIYIKTIAERFDFEKRQIVKELRRHGILSILTTPQALTVDAINKYLELKARQLL